MLLPSPGSRSQHEVELQPAPNQQVALPSRPAMKECDTCTIWPVWVASAWLESVCCTRLLLHPEDAQTEGDALKSLKSPCPRLSLTHRGSGRLSWLDSTDAQAHLVHYLQLGHLFPVAGPQEIAVQTCYLMHSFRSTLRDFVNQCQWPGIPKLGLLSFCVFLALHPVSFLPQQKTVKQPRRLHINENSVRTVVTLNIRKAHPSCQNLRHLPSPLLPLAKGFLWPPPSYLLPRFWAAPATTRCCSHTGQTAAAELR